MDTKTTRRGPLAITMAALALIGALAGPQAARADKGKDGKGPIVGPIVIKPDPQPTPPPKKK